MISTALVQAVEGRPALVTAVLRLVDINDPTVEACPICRRPTRQRVTMVIAFFAQGQADGAEPFPAGTLICRRHAITPHEASLLELGRTIQHFCALEGVEWPKDAPTAEALWRG